MVEHRVVPIDDSVVSEILPVADTFDDSKTIIIVITIILQKYTRRLSLLKQRREPGTCSDTCCGTPGINTSINYSGCDQLVVLSELLRPACSAK